MWKSLKKEQEEKKSATKIFPDKLSSQTCTFDEHDHDGNDVKTLPSPKIKVMHE